MKQYEQNQIFNTMLSTKNTLFGATGADFTVKYAPVSDLGNETVVGGVSEVVKTVDTPHTATVTASASTGSKLVMVDDSASTIEEGDVIEYATGLYAYVRKVVGAKVYLHTPLRASVSVDDVLTQVGNTGEYVTDDISIASTGEFIVSIEHPEYGVFVDERVRVIDPNEDAPVTDPDAPSDTVAVAY